MYLVTPLPPPLKLGHLMQLGPRSIATPGPFKALWIWGEGGLENRLEGPDPVPKQWVVNRICQTDVYNHVLRQFQTSCGACGGPGPWKVGLGERLKGPPSPELQWAAGLGRSTTGTDLARFCCCNARQWRGPVLHGTATVVMFAVVGAQGGSQPFCRQAVTAVVADHGRGDKAILFCRMCLGSPPTPPNW